MSALQTNLESSITTVSNSSYRKTYVDSELVKKAPLFNPALTGTGTVVNSTVSGNLINGITNVLTSLNSKAATSDLLLKAPLLNPALTGEATAVYLTVSGDLINGITNVVSSLNSTHYY